MTQDDLGLRILASIDRRLALLTATHERDLRRAFSSEMLRTESRTKMWAAINGERATPEIAKEAGSNLRVTQIFVKEMLEAGFVKDTETGVGRAVIVDRDDEAIIRWYATRDDGS